jgi:DNA (cytosine-5)-methyltransferase 1
MIANAKSIVPQSSRKRSALDLATWILQKRRPQFARHPAATIKIADLFAGCGGLTLGAEEAIRRRKLGFEIRLAIDLDPQCVAVYARNFDVSSNRLVCGSISDLVPGELGSPLDGTELKVRDHVGQLDIVLAGPPCQGHSDLNNYSRRDDPKNLLYLRAIRFVEVTNPRIAIVENVPAARHDKNMVVQKAADLLGSLGYYVAYATISAHQFGLPQGRRRLVLIAAQRKDPQPLFDRYEKLGTTCRLRDLIGDLEDGPSCAADSDLFSTPSRMTKTNQKRVDYLFRHKEYDLPNSERPRCHRDKKHSYKSMYGRLRWDRIAQTITGGFGSMGQGRFVHPSRKRVITPHEAARIQGFPDYFDFRPATMRTTLHQMIGNAVPPIMTFQPVFDMLADGFLEVGQ